MNDATPSDSSPSEAEPDNAKKALSQGQLIFRIALFLVLAILLLMLGYDRFVARANHEAAYDTLNEMLDETENSHPDDPKVFTREDVQERLNLEPVSEEKGANYVLEHYQWRSGLLFRTYDLYVEYALNDTTELSSASVGKRPFAKPAGATTSEASTEPSSDPE